VRVAILRFRILRRTNSRRKAMGELFTDWEVKPRRVPSWTHPAASFIERTFSLMVFLYLLEFGRIRFMVYQ
jgi:hypothetical protein